MTNSNNGDRLDRIESAIESLADEGRKQLEEIKTTFIHKFIGH